MTLAFSFRTSPPAPWHLPAFLAGSNCSTERQNILSTLVGCPVAPVIQRYILRSSPQASQGRKCQNTHGAKTVCGLEDGWPEPRAHCRTRISSFDISAIWHLLLLSPHLISSRLLAAVSLFSSHLISPHLPSSPLLSPSQPLALFSSSQHLMPSPFASFLSSQLFSLTSPHLNPPHLISPHLSSSQILSAQSNLSQFISFLLTWRLFFSAPTQLTFLSLLISISSSQLIPSFCIPSPLLLLSSRCSSPKNKVGQKTHKQDGTQPHHFPESPSA